MGTCPGAADTLHARMQQQHQGQPPASSYGRRRMPVPMRTWKVILLVGVGNKKSSDRLLMPLHLDSSLICLGAHARLGGGENNE